MGGKFARAARKNLRQKHYSLLKVTDMDELEKALMELKEVIIGLHEQMEKTNAAITDAITDAISSIKSENNIDF